MTGWAAANAPLLNDRDESFPLSEKEDIESGQFPRNESRTSQHNDNSQYSKAKKAETAEAAIARLTHAYTTAMQCVGALYRLSATIEKLYNQGNLNKQSEQDSTKNKPQQTLMAPQINMNSEKNKDQEMMLELSNNSPKHTGQSDDDEECGIDELLSQLIRVARAARSALQDSILLDPLVTTYAPSFYHAFSGQDQTCSAEELIFLQREPFTKDFTSSSAIYFLASAAHRSTIKELAYLSLVNYADLLSCCCFTLTDSILTEAKLLERGVVKTLPGLSLVLRSNTTFAQDFSSCWEAESLKVTKKLTLMSYFDASELNLRSDPSLWLKLACSARSLGKEIILSQIQDKDKKLENSEVCHVNDDSEDRCLKTPHNTLDSAQKVISAIPSHLRRLERYALEKGLASLPDGMPQNRALLKSFEEWKKESVLLSGIYNSSYQSFAKKRKREELKIDLTRYSWSSLGRTLMRACREGNGYVSFPSGQGINNNLPRHIRKKMKQKSTTFGSPTVLLEISPMLTLPPTALGTVCEFLGSGYENENKAESEEIWKLDQDVKKFESTCRALSVAIISARARLEEEKTYQRLQQQHIIIKENLEQETQLERERVMALSVKGSNKGEGDMDQSMNIEEKEQQEQNVDEEKRSKLEYAQSRHRSSKRVQSQLLTSGKAAEKNAKRNSVEYCLLLNILGCTSNDKLYLKLCATKIDWIHLPSLSEGSARLIYLSSSSLSSKDQKKLKGSLLHSIKERRDTRSIEAAARGGPSSLNSFIDQWSGLNSGPFDLLRRFLVHVSLHVEEIFLSETDGTMILSSCVMDCFELLNRRAGNHASFMFSSCWTDDYDVSRIENIGGKEIESFAVNLLITELRMRRCERFGLEIDNFDSDVSTVSYVVPHLVGFSDALGKMENVGQYSSIIPKLRLRSYWLASIYYLWFSRKSNRAADASEAELLALKYLDVTVEAMQNLSSSLKTSSPTLSTTIQTPHLESPGREGDHWKKLNESTLSHYKNCLQAMLIVSHARYRFSKLQALSKKNDEKESSGYVSDGGADQLLNQEKELKEISDDLLQRYAVRDHIGHHHELVSDFIDSHDLQMVQVNQSPKNDGHDQEEKIGIKKWGGLWDTIPNFSQRGESKITSNKNQSLLSILALCLSSKQSNGIFFLSLLARLIITTFDERSKYLNEKHKPNQRFTHNVNADSDFSDDDDDDDDDDVNGGGNPKQKRGGLMSKEEAYLKCIEFFMDKFVDIAYLLKKENNETISCEVNEIIRSADVLSIIQISVHEAAAHTSILAESNKRSSPSTLYDQENELDNQTPNISLLLTSNAFVSSLIEIVGGQYIGLESAFFSSLVRLLVQYKKSFALLLRRKSDKRQSRVDRQKACLAEAECVGVITSLLADIMSSNLPKIGCEGVLEPSLLMLSITMKQNFPIASCSEGLIGEFNNDLALAPLTQMTDSLLWFWKYIVNTDTLSGGSLTGISDRGNTTSVNSIDRGAAKRLIIPIGSAIVALCGAYPRASRFQFANTVPKFSSEENTSLDFFESDESVNDCLSDDDSTKMNQTKDENELKAKETQKMLLHSLCQSVHCIALVFGCIDEKKSCTLSTHPILGNQKPLLPVVVVRVLSHISDTMLSEFQEDEKDNCSFNRNNAIWSQEYPYGTRKIGGQLDLLLHKAYRCLHGFSLGSSHLQVKESSGHVLNSSNSTLDPSKFRFFQPESMMAAAQLYRCVKRTYFHSRKLPPRAALETIASALPEIPESLKSRRIRSFLFSNPNTLSKTYPTDDLLLDMQVGDNLPAGFPEWILHDETLNGHIQSDKDPNGQDNDNSDEDEAYILRKGLYHDLAQGPLPKLGSTETNLDAANAADEIISRNGNTNDRHETSRYERSLWKKFSCILNDLCFSPVNSEGWANAALCLSSKADFICDRLRSLNSSYQKEDFFIAPAQNSIENEVSCEIEQKPSYQVDLLLTMQSKECEDLNKNWIPCLGEDLSVYIRRSWASFSSLLECATEISENARSGVKSRHDELQKNDVSKGALSASDEDEKYRVLEKQIRKMYKTGNFSSWQQAWGGMYVQALRVMAKRCLQISFCIARRKTSDSQNNAGEIYEGHEQLIAEVAETTAGSLYGELQGGVLYGFPMRPIPDLIKRNLANQAMVYFRETMKWLATEEIVKKENNQNPEGEENQCDLWTYHFMIGKCYEKMAGTFSHESYSHKDDSAKKSDEKNKVRMYENLMKESLSIYAKALEEVTQMESEGRLVDQQGGGSSSGATEAFYRLHASRLKILIRAVRRSNNERPQAELEAIRLTSKHHYSELHSGGSDNANVYDDEKSECTDVRDKVWEIFGDIVAAMAQCRVNNSFFHRSVYRHAQSLLLAPIVNNPNDECVYHLGSLGSLPLTRAYHLRGLSTDSCAKSAASIMAPLFDKKRAHICAVWVTTPSKPSPFEVLNDSIRKYDRLRLKYVGAFIDCMKLCRRIDTLETFIGWTSSCRRDLPSFYEESAKIRGKPLKFHHTKDSMFGGCGLVWYAKYYANGAIACIITEELKDLNAQTDKEPEVKENAILEYLKMAYTCFARLRCSLGDEQWRKRFLSKTDVPEADALILAYQSYTRVKKIEDNSQVTTSSTNDVGKWNQRLSLLRSAISICTKIIPVKSKPKKKGKAEPQKS